MGLVFPDQACAGLLSEWSLMSPDKRVVIVTGASRGIGEAIAIAFASCGDRVVVNYLKSDELAEAVVEKVKAAGGDGFAFKADISKLDSAMALCKAAVDRYGRIDVLVNNAGASSSGFLMLTGPSDWQSAIDTNLTGVFNTCKAALPYMFDARSGVIINVASLSGITGLAGEVPYSAAKGGVIAFTAAFAKEVARFNIRVNAVAPGFIESEMTDKMSDAEKKRHAGAVPLGRFGRPSEVSGVVRFLASKEASYITGETLVVSGGMP